MSKNKTVATSASVDEFIEAISNETKRQQTEQLLAIFSDVTKMTPTMWGTSIIGFGQYHYRYDSGREGDMLLTGFSPRVQNFSLYIMSGFEELDGLLKKLGKHKTSKACLYIKSLKDIDLDILKRIIHGSLQDTLKRYPDALTD